MGLPSHKDNSVMGIALNNLDKAGNDLWVQVLG